MSKIADSPYIIREPIKEEYQEIGHLIEESFDPEETMLQSLLCFYKTSMTEEDMKQIKIDLENVTQTMLSNYPCQVVEDTRVGKIVGVNIMVASENPDAEVTERSIDVYETCVPKIKLLVDYFNYMNSIINEAKLFKKYPEAKRALEFYAVAVDRNHRRKNLANRLLNEGIKLARNQGVDLVYGLFTSEYSKKAAVKAGFEKVRDFDLLDIRDREKNQIFEAAAPHNIASVMAINVNLTK